MCSLQIYDYDIIYFQPDGGIKKFSVYLLDSNEENPKPLWQVINQHYWTWDYAQVQVKTDGIFQLLVTAERGDNTGISDPIYKKYFST